MIPILKPLIEPLTLRFPAAWAKARAPHDDGEFNARVCAVLHHEHMLLLVGRNGKRGDPKNLSKDIINWRGEGANFDPTDGNRPCTIIDFIIGHESAGARIDQIYTDPDGPGAWVKPLTLAEIDAGAPSAPPATPVYPPYPPNEAEVDGAGLALFSDFSAAGQEPNALMFRFAFRVAFSWLTKEVSSLSASERKHRDEWRNILAAATGDPCGHPVPGTDGMSTPPLACLLKRGHDGDHK